jgi:hypothetical protein
VVAELSVMEQRYQGVLAVLSRACWLRDPDEILTDNGRVFAWR